MAGFGLLGPKYTNDGLSNIIKECCGDAKLKDAELKIKDVILSCTSIPSYFESYKTKINEKDYDFLDSAIITNRPDCLLFLKASAEHPEIPKSKILLLSVGTGIFPNVVSDNNGLLSWARNIASTLITGSEENEQYQLSLSLPAGNYMILDMPLNM